MLFLDEAQEQPLALLALRYFFENIPELHLIAAGSLLDFALEKVGTPVGRVEFLNVTPLSFIEFLCATGNKGMIDLILFHEPDTPVNDAIHEKILSFLGEYLAIGGMPEVVQLWCETQNLELCIDTQNSIINGYIQDIPKYSRKKQIEKVDIVFKQIPHILGQQFKPNKIVGEYRKRELYPALDLLERAMIIKRIYHTSGQGLPFAGQIDLDKFKLIMIDIALTQSFLNADVKEWILNPRKSSILKGPLIEAFIGQEILAYQTPDKTGELFYWHREERSSTAELDYLISKGQEIIPVKVKSELGTNLKSLRLFLDSHPNSKYGVRFSNHNYSIFDNLHSYPLYAVSALYPNKIEAHQSL